MTADRDLFKPVPFGRQMREAHFLFDPEYTPLNHGSFGMYPRAVQTRLHEIQAMFESRPDFFMHEEAPTMVKQSRAAVAALLNAPLDDIVLVPNASTATNVILRSLTFNEGDVLIHLSTAFGAVQKTLQYLCETTPVKGVTLPVAYPISDDQVVQAFKKGIQDAKLQGKRVRAALLDTISSLPGVRNPWERLVQVCKDEDVLSIVDGAHGIGQISLNLKETRPDFFTSNLHKWLFVPLVCAVLYVPQVNQHMIRSSLPTSHAFEPMNKNAGEGNGFDPPPLQAKSRFVQLFEDVATTDYGAQLCVDTALKFRRQACGGEIKIMDYCKKLSGEAGTRTAELLGTETMESTDGILGQTAFTNVKLPLKLGIGEGEIPAEHAGQVVNWMMSHMLKDYNMYAPIYIHARSFWVRLSGQIYLEMEDFVRGAEAFKTLSERVQTGEYLEFEPQQSAIG